MLGFLVNCVGFKPNRFPKVCMRDGLSAPVANDVEIGLSTTSRNLHVRTPLVPSVEISEKAGREVLLKLENVQPSGSFKIRGIGHLCSKAKANGTKRFVSSSGGNAGAAVAYAGKQLGLPVTVCIPSTTPQFMRDRLIALGAEVLVEGDIWMEADRLARSLSEGEDATYVSPFDHPDIWEGHSTLVEEIKEDLNGIVPGAISVSVGGGGLLLGVLHGIEKVGWMHVPTLAVETEGAASFAATFAKRELVTIQDIDTLAKSLGASCVSAALLPWLTRTPLKSLTVTDRQAVEACGLFSVHHRFVVEPACGATLAVGYDQLLEEALPSGPIVLVVCGGNVATPAALMSWKEQTGAEWPETV